MESHIEKISIKSNYSHESKRLFLGSACNDATKLANDILTFLLSSINNYYKPMSAFSRAFLDHFDKKYFWPQKKSGYITIVPLWEYYTPLVGKGEQPHPQGGLLPHKSRKTLSGERAQHQVLP